MRFTRNIGFLLLGIWLILTGLTYFVPALSALTILFAIIAIIAGILILIER